MSDALFDRTRKALDADGLEVFADPGLSALRLEEDGVRTAILVLAGADVLTCYTTMPGLVPPARIPDVARFASLANADLFLGTVELDEQSFSFAARVSLGCQRLEGIADSVFTLLVADLVAESRWTYRCHAQAVQAVIAGSDPAEALALRTD